MIIFPAIDIKNSQCVRLVKGDMSSSTVFNHSPVEQAIYFEKSGFKFLHIVDLDGAISGESVNFSIIKAICEAVKIPVQVGGGIRSLKDIEKFLSIGVNRVILGTVAIKNTQLVIDACKKFPGKIIIAIDSIKGIVATDGWVKSSKIRDIDLAKKFEYCGASAIIYTNIEKDGTLSGPDYLSTHNIAKNLLIPVIMSGGISSLQDIKQAQKYQKDGIIGVIVGRAIYDKKIDINDLINQFVT
jgi:phosphoribosylformimino-5-aminoimidazole carboxamide ribotide isomerase